MIGAVQLGLAAALVVLFVPMGMAGWHLSRNKILFFGGSLFITLSICVHLTPYFPSVSDFVSSVHSIVLFDNRDDSCINLVNRVSWNVTPVASPDPKGIDDDNVQDKCVFNNASASVECVEYELSWGWSDTGSIGECQFSKLRGSDASDLLNGSWVVVAGDSQARLVVLSLLELVLGDEEKMEGIKVDLFKRHSDYGIVLGEIGLRLDFVWAPYVVNLTSLVLRFKEHRSYPDVFVMGAGLWDMLHVNNVSDYGVELDKLGKLVVSLLPVTQDLGSDDGPVTGSVLIRSRHMFWLGMPVLVNGMLNSEEKRKKMNDDVWHSYDKSLRNSKLIRKYGGPLLLLDVQSVSWNCGPHCTRDGMHYDRVVYEAVVHILLNALLVESHQKLGGT